MTTVKNYVKNLRKIVGHMPLELPGTGVIVFRRVGDKTLFLLQHRADNDRFGLLGGGIELDETYRECANRELFEEAGLFTQEENLILQEVYAGKKHVTVHPNGDVVYHTVVVFTVDYSKCASDNSEVDVQKETMDVAWFDVKGIEELLTLKIVFPNNAPILQDLVDGKFHF